MRLLRRLGFFRLVREMSHDLSQWIRPHLYTSALLLAALAWCPAHVAAQAKVSLSQTPAAVQNGKAQLLGQYDPGQKLRLVFGLQPPHLQEEEQFLRELQDRDSPLFHKYLSAEEWNERFAPSVQDEQALVDWATSQGLTITQRYPNRLLVDVEATVAVIQKAFGVNINRYQVGGAAFYSNDRDPSIPASLAVTVHSLLGLNSVEVMHAASRKTDVNKYPDYAPGPAYFVGTHLQRDAKQNRTLMKGVKRAGADYWRIYAPYDLYSSGGYDYGALQRLGHCCNPLNNPNSSPPEASIAIAIWGDFSDDDLRNFSQDNEFPALAQNVQRYFIDGTPQCCSPETTLDVEWATAMANSFNSSADTAEIHVYEGVDAQFSTILDVLNHALSDGHARVLNMSWGAAENYEAPPQVMDSYHSVFSQMEGQGWTMVAASGDGGATDDCAAHLSVSFPASDPYVTSVGGTTLNGGNYGYQSEYAWSGGPDGCANNDGGGGGGCSAYFAAPGYQGSPACGLNSRSLPDIALNDDGVNTPQEFIYNGYFQPAGGTSIASPEIAGFYAQENAYLLYLQSIVGQTCGGSLSAPCAPLGNGNWYIYYEGLHPPFAAHYPFYDITYGCNGNDITQQYGLTPFCAGPGYDLVTGWGSANMLQLAWMMNAFVAGDFAGPTVTFSGPLLNHWYNTDQEVGWTIADVSSNGHLPTGVAGYTNYWDTDPGDAYSEATPQTGYPDPFNSFYYGPFYPNNSTGSVPLSWGAWVAIPLSCEHGTILVNPPLIPTGRSVSTMFHPSLSAASSATGSTRILWARYKEYWWQPITEGVVLRAPPIRLTGEPGKTTRHHSPSLRPATTW